MDGLVVIDTMRLNVRYPKADIFRKWYQYAQDVDHRRLLEGIPVGDFVVRGGGSCYKVSVWQHDARVYLTDWVDEKAGEGNGSGILVQLGPKFLIHHGNNLRRAVLDLLAAVGVVEDYPIRITRLDLALDLFGVAINDQDLNKWRCGWVGRSKASGFHLNSRSGELETINVGSRVSPVYLRIYNKVAQAVAEGDIDYWLDVWKGFSGAVTRVEWEIKPNEGNFSEDLKDFHLFTGFSVRELLNYLITWGRLCIPNPNDSNNRRWELAPFWKSVSDLAAAWTKEITWPITRYGKDFHGITDHYVKFLAGTIAGGMARFGESSPDMIGLFEGLKEYGQDLDTIKQKAVSKAAVYSKL